MNTLPFGKPLRYLNLKHCSLPYWRIGQGPDLVFVHGWPLDSRTFRHLVAQLSDRFSCHLIDLPGAGLAHWGPDTPFGLEPFADLLCEAIDQMDIEASSKITFVAHDSGGGMARLAASKLGGRVAGLVLGNTETPGRYSPLFRQLFALGATPLAERALKWMGSFRQLYPYLGMVSRRNLALMDEIGPLFLEPLAQSRPRRLAALQLLQNSRPGDFDRLTEVHSKLEVPVHLIWGTRDRWFPLKDVEAMMPEFVGPVELTTTDKAALLVHEENPELFKAALTKLHSSLNEGVALQTA